MRAMAEQAVAAADASPTLAPSPGSPWHRDTDGTKPQPASTREDSGGRDGCGIIFPVDGDTKPLPSPQPAGMLLADIPRGPQPRLSLAKSRTAPSSPSVSPSESRAALLRLREAKLEDTKRRLSEAVQEPLSRLSRLMAEESSPTARLKAGGSPGRGEPGGRGAGGRRVRDWSPWEPSLNCRYEICSYGDVIQVVEVVQQEAEPPEQPPAARPGGSVPGRALVCIALLAYGYLVLPLPPYAAGLCLGLTGGLLLGFLAILLLLLKPPPPRGRLRPELLPGGPRGAHGLQVGEGWLWVLGLGARSWMLGLPKAARHHGAAGSSPLQGWLNQLHVYDPELYHPSLTHSVLATLDGATLKLSYPKNNIPRRAAFAEEILEATFISQRCYDMTDAKVTAELPLGAGGCPLAGTPSASRPLLVLQVFLCPPCLARKRLWNKKYPICILFPDRPDTEHRSSDEHGTEPQGDEGMKKPQVPTQDIPGDCRERCLYLFGRTGREKEEWYQHLLRACHGTPSSSHGEARPGEMWPLLHTGTDPWLGAAPCQDRLWEGSRERGGRWRSWDRAHQPTACAAAGAPRHPSLQPARSCPRVPRHGTGSAEHCQQQWREHRGHPLCHQTQGPGWKCPTEDFSGLQHLHGPLRAGRGWGQPGAEPPSQRAEQPYAREGEWGRSSPQCRCLLALLFTSSLLAP